MFSTVVVPLDRSKDSLRALKPARVFADAVGAELVATTVVHDARERIHLERELRQRIKLYGVEVNAVVAYINSYSVSEGLHYLMNRSEETLLVMATHGHSHTTGIVGSVSEELLHEWPGVPAILVGPRVDVDEFALTGAIVACVDTTKESESVIRPVERFSEGFGLDPWVVSVVEPVSVNVGAVDAAGQARPSVMEPRVDSGLVHVIADRMQERCSVPVNWEVLHGKHPAESLVDYASGLGASLIAVATRKRSGLSRLALGSVAMETVAKASCPVLAVHAEAVS